MSGSVLLCSAEVSTVCAAGKARSLQPPAITPSFTNETAGQGHQMAIRSSHWAGVVWWYRGGGNCGAERSCARCRSPPPAARSPPCRLVTLAPWLPAPTQRPAETARPAPASQQRPLRGCMEGPARPGPASSSVQVLFNGLHQCACRDSIGRA